MSSGTQRYTEIDVGCWSSDPVVIVGAGPSVDLDRITQIRGRARVVAVKGVMFSLDWADCGFGLDIPRFREWTQRFGTLSFPVWWAMPEDRKVDPVPQNVRLLRRMRTLESAGDPDSVYCTCTSGFGALHFVSKMKGPRPLDPRVFLVGYDYRQVGGAWHSTPQHYQHRRSQSGIRWRDWAGRYSGLADLMLAQGICVWNATEGSALTTFGKMSLSELLEEL